MIETKVLWKTTLCILIDIVSAYFRNKYIFSDSICKKDEIIFGTYGIHPHEAKNDKVTSELIIDEIKKNKKIIGIGETGLDFYYNYSDKNDQISSLEQHIEASIELDMPLIIHSRNAEDETFEILNEYKKDKLKILMHCFTGSKKFAEKLLDLNAFFSASGIITFKNSKELQARQKNRGPKGLIQEITQPKLEYLEIESGRYCNLKCRSCGPNLSSSWDEDVKNNDKVLTNFFGSNLVPFMTTGGFSFGDFFLLILWFTERCFNSRSTFFP